MLASWDSEALQDWGMDADLLKNWNTDAGALGLMLELNEEVPDFKEYDESIEDEVEYITCPHCNMSFPK